MKKHEFLIYRNRFQNSCFHHHIDHPIPFDTKFKILVRWNRIIYAVMKTLLPIYLKIQKQIDKDGLLVMKTYILLNN